MTAHSYAFQSFKPFSVYCRSKIGKYMPNLDIIKTEPPTISNLTHGGYSCHGIGCFHGHFFGRIIHNCHYTGLDAQSITTTGIITGGAVFLLGVTNLMEVVSMIVPMTVVCRLKISAGLQLASKGIRDIQKLSWGGGYDCIGVTVACALLSMFWLRDNENGMKWRE